MKNIKYRSAHYNYDGTFNGFTYWGKIDLLGRFSESSFAGHTNRMGTTIKTDEMFTGMEDLNSQHIYEGDINQDGGVVVWNEDSASFCWNYPGIEMMPFENEPDWCVITTNIHEKETQHPQSAASSHSEEE